MRDGPGGAADQRTPRTQFPAVASHDNHHYQNVYAYVGQGLGVCSQTAGHEDYFYGNKLVTTGTKVGGFACDGDAKTVWCTTTPTTSPSTSPKGGGITECKMDLAAWQAKGEDSGSTVATWPKDDDVIKMAKAKLGF